MHELVHIRLGQTAIAIVGAVAAVAAFVVADEVQETMKQSTVAEKLTGGNATRAPRLLRRYGCAGCHTIPGVPGADGQTGPPLADLSKRIYIGGVVVNSSENLVAWIVSPHRFSPGTAMPETGVTEQDAKDMAAYLYAH